VSTGEVVSSITQGAISDPNVEFQRIAVDSFGNVTPSVVISVLIVVEAKTGDRKPVLKVKTRNNRKRVATKPRGLLLSLSLSQIQSRR
jgi:hypothetical protein